MKMSASELVKRSASQLLFMHIKKLQYAATSNQLKGNKYSEEVVKKENASSEKRGIIKYKNNLLFFCIDMVKDNRYVEIKMVNNPDTYEAWYFQSSILQATLYASLLEKVNTLDTPKFRKKEGFLQQIIQKHTNPQFELWFGADKYLVYPNDKVYKHYIKKLDIIESSVELADFDKTREFDQKYKHKEFTILKPKFTKIT